MINIFLDKYKIKQLKANSLEDLDIKVKTFCYSKTVKDIYYTSSVQYRYVVSSCKHEDVTFYTATIVYEPKVKRDNLLLNYKYYAVNDSGNIKLEKLPVSNRLYNAMYRNYDLQQELTLQNFIDNFNSGEIFKFRNLGKTSVEEALGVLLHEGYIKMVDGSFSI